MTDSIFKDQREDEDIKLILRRHWMHFAGPIATLTAMALMPVFFYVSASFLMPFVLKQPFLNATILAVVLYYLFGWLYFFMIWTDYYLDVWIVTSKRIIDVEQRGLFNREVSEFKLYRIQDITIEVKGVLQTFLKYGDVHIQTAGEKQEFIFKQIPNPNSVKNIIFELYSKSYKENLTKP